AAPSGARCSPPPGVARARGVGRSGAGAHRRGVERGRPALPRREPAGAGAARVAGAVLVCRGPPPLPRGPGGGAGGGYGVRAAALRAVRVAGTAGCGVVRRAATRAGDRAGVGARSVVPGDAGRGDVGAGAAGRPASFYSARRGRQRHRGESRAHRDLGTGARRLPRAGRRRAAGAGRGPYGRSDAVKLRTTYEDLAKDARVGARILLDDGLLSVEVTRIAPPRVEGRVVDGGTLTAHKGMNLPGLQVSAPALTQKDREDVAHAAGLGVDY